MSSKAVSLLVSLLLFTSAGCDSGSGLENPDQPADLGAPWVNKTDSQFGSSMTSSDAAGNRVFSCSKSDFGSLLQDIAAEYMSPIVVTPKKMLDWNLTVEVKGKNLDEVLNDIATKCKLTLGKSSAGHPMLTFASDASGEEHVVKPEAENGWDIGE
jgi:hypothetical protein